MSRIVKLGLCTALLTAAGGVGFVPSAAARERNSCINPAGADLNVVYETQDAFITPFCTEAHVGDWWRPLVRWVGAAEHGDAPAGYVPVGATPAEDFLAKLQSVRYVVDAGTAQERSYTFAADDLIVARGSAPEGEFVAYTARLHPLPPGDHTVAIYVSLSGENWDGLGTAPENHSAAGESLLSTVAFDVRTGRG